MQKERRAVDQRLSGFIQFLQEDLPKTHGAELRGSWLTLEYHAMLNPVSIVSFSDVDFVIECISKSSRDAVETAVLAAAATSCIVINGGVSLRNRAEMDLMWSLPPSFDSACTKAGAEHFTCFWSLVGAAETCLPPPRGVALDPWHRYQITKYFLRLWRTLAIACGLHVRSWEEALAFAGNALPYKLRRATLDIKLGNQDVDNWPAFMDRHVRALLNYLSAVVHTADNNCLPARMILRLTQCTPQERVLCFSDALFLAERFEVESTTRQAARRRLITKANYS